MSGLTLFNLIVIAPTVLVFAFHYLDWTDVQLVNERLDTDAAIESIRVVLDRMLRAEQGARGWWVIGDSGRGEWFTVNDYLPATPLFQHPDKENGGEWTTTLSTPVQPWTTTLARKP